jgi:hypothetical protein
MRAPLRTRLVLAAVLAALAGCSVAAREAGSYAGPKNECQGTCVDGECIDGACRASETSYDFLFEVTPPSAAHYAPNVTFVLADTSSRSKGTRPLPLPTVSHLTVRSSNKVPLAIKLTRGDWIPGTSGGSYEARDKGGSDGRAELDVPPHDYDLYVAPANEKDQMVYPPFVEKIPLGASGEVTVPYDDLAAFKKITVNLADQDGNPLKIIGDARDVTLIDTSTGDVVSTLARTCDDVTTATVRFRQPITSHTYVLRIAPPAVPCKAGDTVPLMATFDVDLAALTVEGGSGNPTVKLPNATKAISFVGSVQVAGSSTDRPVLVPSSLVFRSSKLDGLALGRAWSNVPVSADGGIFHTSLLPGNYTVEIAPSVSDSTAQKYALRVQKDVIVSASLISSTLKALEVFPKTRVTGSIVSLDGSLFGLGVIDANTSTTLLSIAPDDTPTPRSASTTIALVKDKATASEPNPPTYNLSLSLDDGMYDFVVRIPEASGFPWIVRDAVAVPRAPIFALGTMTVTSPVVITGRVTDPNGDPVARATVRARALRTTGGLPIAAVLVAETKADELGNYSLMLPKALDSASSATK